MSKLTLKSWPSSSVFGDSWGINSVFDSLFPDFGRLLDVKVDYPIDYSFSEYTENDSEIYIDIPLAGHKKEDIEVTVQDGYLQVVVKPLEKRKDAKYLKNGISQKPRKWKWDILDKGDTEKVESKFENGLLSITIPKVKPVEAPVKRIEVK